jgi:benzodiazapine receptor
METANWYKNLIKPSFAPPSWLFGPVWAILYTIIFATYGYIVYLVSKGRLSKQTLIPLVLNLLFNFLFSPIQFSLQNNLLAAIDITLVLGTLVWLIVLLLPHRKVLALAQIPYLLWVSFATILQFSITWLNR